MVNFPPRQIGPFMSEVLVLGFPDAPGEVCLVAGHVVKEYREQGHLQLVEPLDLALQPPLLPHAIAGVELKR